MPRRSACLVATMPIFLTAVVSVAASQAQRRVAVRFHHVHYAVPDPAAAMSQAVSVLHARRVILPGLGVGVAAGEHYLLFERGETMGPATPGGVSDAIDVAMRWFDAVGIGVTRLAAGGAAWLEASETRQVRHVAFAADDLAAVADHLRAQGVEPLRQSDDSLIYQPRSGGLVEVVRETDRPDAFWCPMHPDVRSSSAATCPLCSMALVPMPPPKLGDYRMEVSRSASRVRKGATDLRFTIRDPESGATVDRFMEVHERLFHLFVVSRDLSYFAHEHPELANGRFELTLDLPAGAYMLIADFLPAGGTPQMVQHAIVIGRLPTAFPPAEGLKPDPRDKVVDGVRVRLTPDLEAGREGRLTFSFSDAATDAPIRDLQPYLGASGHVLIVKSDLTDAFHAHPGLPATSGPDVTFAQVLPSAGFYKLWVQVQRGGNVITVPFVIEVR